MPKTLPLRLGVNVDHVATLRNARGGDRPDPVRAALLAIEAGADGITAHLREDRRHIRDEDMARLKAEISRPLNFEMAATEDMLRTCTGYVRTAWTDYQSGLEQMTRLNSALAQQTLSALQSHMDRAVKQSSGPQAGDTA